MGLEEIGDLALHNMLSKLGPKHTAVVGCVNKRLKVTASDESLWSQFCIQELHFSSPLDPLFNPLPSFKVAYGQWREAFAMYPWTLVLRVKRCWDTLKYWLDANFPEAAATLCKGASESEIETVEYITKLKLPLPTRLLYRFCDGQDFTGKDLRLSSDGSSLGIIGGYSLYDHFVNVFLLPLRQVVLETKEINSQLSAFSTGWRYLLVAASSTDTGKLFFLDCKTGQLHVGTRNLPIDGELMPCVPTGLLNSVHDSNGDQQQDAMLLWLEEHGRRLEKGIIKLREEGNRRSISQFPEEPPLCSTAVTNGIKVRASAVFIPELADLQDIFHKYYFAYSIRMSLLPEGCIINGMYFSSCQLHMRHWVIKADGAVVSNVDAEAVIGKFPLLLPGEKDFVYESCTPLQCTTGSIEGSFTFVPGRLQEPKGASFEAEVAQFPLQVPDYIF